MRNCLFLAHCLWKAGKVSVYFQRKNIGEASLGSGMNEGRLHRGRISPRIGGLSGKWNLILHPKIKSKNKWKHILSVNGLTCMSKFPRGEFAHIPLVFWVFLFVMFGSVPPLTLPTVGKNVAAHALSVARNSAILISAFCPSSFNFIFFLTFTSIKWPVSWTINFGLWFDEVCFVLTRHPRGAAGNVWCHPPSGISWLSSDSTLLFPENSSIFF